MMIIIRDINKKYNKIVLVMLRHPEKINLLSI